MADLADLAALTAAVEAGNRTAAAAETQAALDAGVDPRTILGAMTAAMDVVGRKFQEGELFVPEMLIAARAMKAGMELLEPVLLAAGVTPEHRAIVGTVEGDLHDIGKNLVGMMWKGGGIEVIDLGVNVPAARFVEAAIEHDVHLIGLSALLTTTMPNMRGVVEAIRAAEPVRQGRRRRGPGHPRVRRPDRRRRLRPRRRVRGGPGPRPAGRLTASLRPPRPVRGVAARECRSARSLRGDRRERACIAHLRAAWSQRDRCRRGRGPALPRCRGRRPHVQDRAARGAVRGVRPPAGEAHQERAACRSGRRRACSRWRAPDGCPTRQPLTLAPTWSPRLFARSGRARSTST